VLADGEMIVGDGTTDPVAESGATLRTSIGVGTGDSPTFTGLTLSSGLTTQGQSAISIEPFSTGAGQTGEIRFLELAASGTNYIGFKAPDALAGNVIWTLPATDSSGTQFLSSDGAGTLSWAASSTSFASIAETDTGTETAKAVTPDGLAGSNYGEKGYCIAPFESDTDCAVGDGKVAFTVPSTIDGWNLVDVIASCHTKGTTGTMDIQVRARSAGVDTDMLSTKVTMADTEFFASDGVVDGANDDVVEGNEIITVGNY